MFKSKSLKQQGKKRQKKLTLIALKGRHVVYICNSVGRHVQWFVIRVTMETYIVLHHDVIGWQLV